MTGLKLAPMALDPPFRKLPFGPANLCSPKEAWFVRTQTHIIDGSFVGLCGVAASHTLSSDSDRPPLWSIVIARSGVPRFAGWQSPSRRGLLRFARNDIVGDPQSAFGAMEAMSKSPCIPLYKRGKGEDDRRRLYSGIRGRPPGYESG